MKLHRQQTLPPQDLLYRSDFVEKPPPDVAAPLPSKAELISLIRQRDQELARLAPQVQRLQAEYASHHSHFLRRTEELEARLLTCNLIAKVPEGSEKKRSSHLEGEYKQMDAEKKRAKKEKEEAEERADEKEHEEEDIAEAFLSDVAAFIPASKEVKQRHNMSATPSPTPALDHAHHTHAKANQWDPTIPPGGKIVDVRVWHGEPSKLPSWEAYSSVRNTHILAPQAKDEATRMRFLKAEADMMDEAKGPPKVPMAEARIVDSDALLVNWPQERIGPFWEAGYVKNLYPLYRMPREVIGHDLYFTPIRDGYVAAQGRPERKAFYQAPADYWEARDHPSYTGLTEFLDPKQAYHAEMRVPGLKTK